VSNISEGKKSDKSLTVERTDKYINTKVITEFRERGGVVGGYFDGKPMVLVTHHLEEVPPGFDRALLLARGRVVAQGPIDEVLADAPLSAAYEIPLRVSRDGGRYAARRP
jgi:ABC-type sugar transport system ATPase subunit